MDTRRILPGTSLGPSMPFALPMSSSATSSSSPHAVGSVEHSLSKFRHHFFTSTKNCLDLSMSSPLSSPAISSYLLIKTSRISIGAKEIKQRDGGRSRREREREGERLSSDRWRVEANGTGGVVIG